MDKLQKEIDLLPDEAPHTLAIFAKEVFRGWGMKLTGTLGLVLTICAGFIYGREVAFATASVGVIILFDVCYQLWKTARQRSDAFKLKLTDTRNELRAERERKDSNLTGRITEFVFSFVPLTENADWSNFSNFGTGVRLKFCIYNAGHPVSLLKVHLEVNCGGHKYEAKPDEPLIDDITVLPDVAEYLSNRSLLETHKLLEGELRFQLLELSPSSWDGSRMFTICVTDGSGRIHKIFAFDNDVLLAEKTYRSQLLQQCEQRTKTSKRRH